MSFAVVFVEITPIQTRHGDVGGQIAIRALAAFAAVAGFVIAAMILSMTWP
jgi:hypothetical protein